MSDKAAPSRSPMGELSHLHILGRFSDCIAWPADAWPTSAHSERGGPVQPQTMTPTTRVPDVSDASSSAHPAWVLEQAADHQARLDAMPHDSDSSRYATTEDNDSDAEEQPYMPKPSPTSVVDASDGIPPTELPELPRALNAVRVKLRAASVGVCLAALEVASPYEDDEAATRRARLEEEEEEENRCIVTDAR